ncbi:PTS sugar transporter subunit IIA [Enterococcus xiangfangensis]|uniref:PTS sugar transporter subunit IIA n=1 Tax=Enterococcus xiangfangensis TaxID=1296537 RepID=A0ABU3FEU3_9ENTE|nr:PTS sugar transporter subunit IIA [Enterococcus xiangfangensis]MDT2760145.1 PTS sugar transporter subunit IIA [Enterococcus xiangfangensis]
MTDSVFVQENIFINEDPISDKETLFEFIAENAKNLNYVSSKQDCFDGLLERESQQTTGFQDGFAIPHCKNNTVVSPKMLYIKTKPIPWDSLDGKEITDSFALLIPEKGAEEHLKILSKIARSLIDTGYRDNLKNAKTKSEIFELISKKLEV